MPASFVRPDHQRILDGGLRLSADIPDEINGTHRERSPTAVSRVDAAGVHNGKGMSRPLRLAEQAVTGGAGNVVNDGNTFAGSGLGCAVSVGSSPSRSRS